MPIREIHLIHHTHSDFGYTDLPSTSFEILSDYLRQAVDIAGRTAGFPEEARFHYTCEITEVYRRFAETAKPGDLAKMDGMLASGQFELGAMPFHITPLLGRGEWEATLEASRAIFAKHPPKTGFQNDINGLPWGLVPSFAKLGVEFVMVGLNTYSGGAPPPQPSGFWWEGPDGSRVLAWLATCYCAGYSLFYPEEWRRGPVPAYDDVWFNPPRGREIFDERPPALLAAKAHLEKSLADQYGDYPHDTLGIQVTNMWRMDNDPPCEQICHFVKAWNEAGFEPRLRLSTPAKFLAQIRNEAADQLPVLRGDWGNWWADGPASMPTETALAQQAKMLLSDIHGGAAAVGAQPPDAEKLAAAWRNASLYTEHTFSSWDSLANPYQPLALGGFAQKADFAYRADEEARLLRAEALRASPAFCPASLSRCFTVVNPGKFARSGWVQISAQALREPANAVRDEATNHLYPLETILGPKWGVPKPDAYRPFEIPNDIFPFEPVTLRFFCPSVSAGSQKRFRLVQEDVAAVSATPESASAAGFSFTFNPSSGLLSELRHVASGVSLLDSAAPFGLGQPVIELPQGFAAREDLLNRKKELVVIRETPALASWTSEPSAFGARFRCVWDHPSCHRIEQTWDFLDSASRFELTSTFWLKETIAPLCIYLAFPFRLPRAQAAYDSLGYRTRVGVDQLPGTCAEYHAVGGGVEWSSPGGTLAMTTIDTPLVMFESPAMRLGRTTFTPNNEHIFPVVSQNYWLTNFPQTKAAKFSVHHTVAFDQGSSSLLEKLHPSLWDFPST